MDLAKDRAEMMFSLTLSSMGSSFSYSIVIAFVSRLLVLAAKIQLCVLCASVVIQATVL